MTAGAGIARRQGIGGRLRAQGYAAIVTLTDLLPPRIRYGYAHRATRMLFSGALPRVTATTARRRGGEPAREDAARGAVTAALVADDLDIGGIGSVIEMLATALAGAGVRPIVVCPRDGERALRLRASGIEVRIAGDAVGAGAVLRESGAEVVQLHSAPAHLEEAAIASGLPLVTAMHNTEIHFTKARWGAFTRLMEHSHSGVAVSETVRAFHARHLPEQLAARLVVVPNGAPALDPATPEQRVAARRALGDAVGAPGAVAAGVPGAPVRDGIADDVVFLCLARYDSQKNIAGSVVAFLRAAALDPGIRLVFAGDPSDWAELRRAESLRDLSPFGDRVHLLGNSDAVTLLTAADAFLLDSFFEGWPVAATEAAAAGLPLVLSDMGGAVELVERDPRRSVVVANPSGDAAGVSDARVRTARRRTRRQPNAEELADAIVRTAALVRDERARAGAGAGAGASGAGAPRAGAPGAGAPGAASGAEADGVGAAGSGAGAPRAGAAAGGEEDGVAAMARAHAELLRSAARGRPAV